MRTRPLRDIVHALPEGALLPTSTSERLRAALGPLTGRVAAAKLVRRAGPIGLARMPAPELAGAADVPLRLAERVVAARSLREALGLDQGDRSETARELGELLPSGLAELETESVFGLALTATLGVIGIVLLAKGGRSATSVDVRDVLLPMVRLNARAMVLVHNHPGGDPMPSEDDVRLTNAVAKAGRILGIELLDHVIFAVRGSVSFREMNLLPTDAEIAAFAT